MGTLARNKLEKYEIDQNVVFTLKSQIKVY